MKSVVVGEVLELHQHVGEARRHSSHELFQEGVVLLPLEPALRQADVERIIQKGLILRAHVEHDGQRRVGGDAGAGCVERQLAHGDAHAVGSLVAQA